jgi:hypothetical protein
LGLVGFRGGLATAMSAVARQVALEGPGDFPAADVIDVALRSQGWRISSLSFFAAGALAAATVEENANSRANAPPSLTVEFMIPSFVVRAG